MRKIISLVLVIVLSTMGLCGCGSSGLEFKDSGDVWKVVGINNSQKRKLRFRHSINL